MEDSGSSLAEIDSDCICHTVAGRPVKPKTLGQKAYVDAIREKMVVFWRRPPEPEKHTLQWRWRSPRSETMK